jgi:hypothetical protein
MASRRSVPPGPAGRRQQRSRLGPPVGPVLGGDGRGRVHSAAAPSPPPGAALLRKAARVAARPGRRPRPGSRAAAWPAACRERRPSRARRRRAAAAGRASPPGVRVVSMRGIQPPAASEGAARRREQLHEGHEDDGIAERHALGCRPLADAARDRVPRARRPRRRTAERTIVAIGTGKGSPAPSSQGLCQNDCAPRSKPLRTPLRSPSQGAGTRIQHEQRADHP